MSSYIHSSDPTASALVYQSVSSTSTVSTSSSTWISGGLSLTVLETGTYLALYSGGMSVEAGGNGHGQVRLTLAGTPITAATMSTRTTVGLVLGLIGTTNIDAGGSNIIIPIVASAGQSIALQVSSQSGTTTLNTRTLTIIKVA